MIAIAIYVIEYNVMQQGIEQDNKAIPIITK